MMYRVELLPEAHEDLGELAYTIAYTYGMPKTSEKYVRELRAVIESLQQNPERYAVRNCYSLLQYGYNVRRVNYKKMAIIYTIDSLVVSIHRVIPSSLITD